ncbi:U32 family peptidase [Muribaculaceae bacterium Isolate-004 (NCI)]|nr:U32 family peptidase [Muribaculaceae bacterium Isolate-004 (NCI)]
MPRSDQAKQLELLAPARNADIAIEAIRHGADAVYIGPPSHGARHVASNSFDDLRRATDFAHRFDARIYATVNTIVYDSELAEVERMIHQLYRCGIDALIVQDLGITRLDLPPMALHASTQCDIRTPAKAQFLQSLGFTRLVLPRELTFDEIADIAGAITILVEVFVHGALCVSYSGDCRASQALKGRSANRGECAQICRLPFDLTGPSGEKIIERRHLLSLRDLNRLTSLDRLIEAGATSFKIEGRLKDETYVKNVVGAYSNALNRIVDASEGTLRRSSSGTSRLTFTPDPEKSFNRGFTGYFGYGNNPHGKMASTLTPKWIGQPVGKVVRSQGNRIEANLTAELHNGDGLGYFDTNGQYTGFRLNKADGNRLFPASPTSIKPGTTLYRNTDKQWDDIMTRPTASRTISARIELYSVTGGIALRIEDEDGNYTALRLEGEFPKAQRDPLPHRAEILAKTGGTDFRIERVTDRCADIFVPAAALTELRRQAVDSLQRVRRVTYERERPGQPSDPATASPLPSTVITPSDNVANHLAHELYRQHGATAIDPAMEASGNVKSGTRLMTTRYCLRREMDRCLKTATGRLWPQQLTLQSGNIRLSLEFDCRNCRMHVVSL